jgi:Mg2+ and Co2+ transporter CorA
MALLESIFMQVIAGVEEKSVALSDELDLVEERLIVDLDDDIPKRLAQCRRLAVRLHRLLATQRSAIGRFEQNTWQTTGKANTSRRARSRSVSTGSITRWSPCGTARTSCRKRFPCG